MSKLSDRLTDFEAKQDAAIVRAIEEVEFQRALLAELKSEATSQADLDIIARLETKTDALDPSLPEMLPEE